MEILEVEIDVMGKHHKLRLMTEQLHQSVWTAKIVDDSKTVIQRFETDTISYGFSQIANYLLSCGKIVNIKALGPECAAYSTLLMRSIVMRERKSRPSRQYVMV